MSGQIEHRGSHVIAGRTRYDQSNLTNGQFSQTAKTDGLVIAVLGTVSANLSVRFGGMLMATTANGGLETSSLVTSATTTEMVVNSGKKVPATLFIPNFGNLTMAVREGEVWSLTLLAPPAGAGFVEADLEFFWVALKAGGRHDGEEAVTTGASAPSAISSAFQKLRDTVQAGGAVGFHTPETVVAAQRTIDNRVGDFVRVLGDAAGVKAAEAERGMFVADLQAIVCRASLDGTAAQDVLPAKLDALTSTFARLTGHDFSAHQRQLLQNGIRALVAINETAQTRQDLGLIQRNITFFIDSVETSLGRKIDDRNRRLLTRALVRLVGDGAAPAEAVQPSAAAAE